MEEQGKHEDQMVALYQLCQSHQNRYLHVNGTNMYIVVSIRIILSKLSNIMHLHISD